MTHASVSEDERKALGITDTLVSYIYTQLLVYVCVHKVHE